MVQIFRSLTQRLTAAVVGLVTLAALSALPARALPSIASLEQSGVANYEVLEWNPVILG